MKTIVVIYVQKADFAARENKSKRSATGSAFLLFYENVFFEKRQVNIKDKTQNIKIKRKNAILIDFR